ncbi:MAG TPA: hypothetical protein VGI39_30130 [Polyangiaceae bacterium]|jgi:hypothetical protein
MTRAARHGWRSLFVRAGVVGAGALAALTFARAAAAQETPSPFACFGEAQAIETGVSTADLAQERDKRVTEPAPEGETPAALAHRMCVIAELMSRLGDADAPDYFERAIAAAPDEGGYELWYGAYLGGVRGATLPLIERAEVHLYRALDKVRARKARGAARPFDATTEEWAERRLIDLYQSDGLPALPWKGYPYSVDGTNGPGLFVTGQGRASIDTNDFVDVSDVRKFTAESAFAGSIERLNRDLTRSEKQTLVRAPARYEVLARARIRQNILGAIDLGYRSLWIEHGQIMRFDQPTNFVDARVQQYGVTYHRALDLYPFADATVEASYQRVDRVGIVEYFPNEYEHIDMIEAKPALSRFLGPDKLTIGSNIVYMAMPDIVGGSVDQRKRGRAITAFYFDYAIYRPLLLPSLSSGGMHWHRKNTRGWHFFGGAAFDNEVYGTRLVQKRDYYGGTSLLGLGPWDFTLQGTVFQSGVTDAEGFDLHTLANGQYRTSFVPLFRIIDGEAIPGLPAGGSPAFLNLVFPMRWDVALQGAKDFENFRVGAELWTRFISPGLRGASILASGGYSFQYFYNLDKPLHVARIDVGLGW